MDKMDKKWTKQKATFPSYRKRGLPKLKMELMGRLELPTY